MANNYYQRLRTIRDNVLLIITASLYLRSFVPPGCGYFLEQL